MPRPGCGYVATRFAALRGPTFDELNQGVGLAIIESIDFDRRAISLVSPVPTKKVRVLQLGDLYIGLDGRELGQVDREGF